MKPHLPRSIPIEREWNASEPSADDCGVDGICQIAFSVFGSALDSSEESSPKLAEYAGQAVPRSEGLVAGVVSRTNWKHSERRELCGESNGAKVERSTER